MALTVTEILEPTSIRRMIAGRLGASHRDAVQVPLHRTVDVTSVVTASRADPAAPNLVDTLLMATARALVDHPSFNGVVKDGKHALVREVNIGVAADTPHGLLVPVIREVDRLSPGELRFRRKEISARVLARKHTLEDLSDGTFTVSNLGTLGIDVFDPIINPPQLAILGVGRVREEVVADGASGMCVAARMTLSLCFDHRFHDGAPAARFLASIASGLEAGNG
ncbi:2-oxo acid dehydrogenase subunit E2 [Amycolatopsis pithecellobii]|uniref:2-oxoacid dehydrogenase acyltransferase catalytic domain-containing protein n=1 Tax=Amycolatopsis pithecellobii TaxID=664692 RepID=A0A6N7YRL1_9PSEU|nr:2-oxo acid dehydrogenase subunit E2 [Amycolatopsis pithecellobii]MTD55665.1 hypothetical protein [Amycolatopsis pithecellobii]